MDFKTLDPTEGLRQHLHQRLNQLENEYLSNKAALIVATAAVAGTSPSDTDKAELARLNGNLAVLDKAHAAVVIEHAKIPATVVPPKPK